MKCKNCQAKFEGTYCNACGEKVIREGDFALKKIFSQALDSLTHLDSKLFKTMKLLFFYPGKLSSQYIEGVRVPYMKPFQIFIISNIFFFILFSNEDLFRIPAVIFFKENFEGFRIMDKVMELSSKTGLSQTEIANQYEHSSINLAKGLLILLIPIIAWIGKLLHYKQKMEFGKHLIFSTHFFTFFLLFFAISGLFLFLTPDGFNRRLILIPLGLIICIYYIMALKNFYKNSNTMALIKGVGGIFLILLSITLYKSIVSLIALYTL